MLTRSVLCNFQQAGFSVMLFSRRHMSMERIARELRREDDGRVRLMTQSFYRWYNLSSKTLSHASDCNQHEIMRVLVGAGGSQVERGGAYQPLATTSLPSSSRTFKNVSSRQEQCPESRCFHCCSCSSWNGHCPSVRDEGACLRHPINLHTFPSNICIWHPRSELDVP